MNATPSLPSPVPMPMGSVRCARPRLLGRLDAASAAPLVWIAGPPGSGKTTLMASWLEHTTRPAVWCRLDTDTLDADVLLRELAAAIRAQAWTASAPDDAGSLRQRVRAWLACLAPGTVLVLDDCDEAAEAALDALLPRLVDALPRGMTVLAASRHAAPPGLARQRTQGRVAVVDWTTLRLEPEEAAGLLRALGCIHAEVLTDRIEQAAGWVTGLGLLAAAPAEGPDPCLPPALRDYFRTQVFDRLDPDERSALLHTAALPRLEAAAIVALGGADAEPRIAALAERQWFVAREGAGRYAIHPLFRRFLCQQRDRELAPDRLRALLAASARQVATADPALAADLFAAARDWLSLLATMDAAVPEALRAGDRERVAGWLERLPEALRRDEPRVALWRGSACPPGDTAGAEAALSAAWQACAAQADTRGMVAVVTAALERHAGDDTDMRAVGHWLERVLDLARRNRHEMPLRLEARLAAAGSVLTRYRPDLPVLRVWAGRLPTLLAHADDPDLARRLIGFGVAHHFWRGEAVHCAALLEGSDPALLPDAGALARVLVRSAFGTLDDVAPDSDFEPARATAAALGLGALLAFIGGPASPDPGEAARPATLPDRTRIDRCRRAGRHAEALAMQELRVQACDAHDRALDLGLAQLEAGMLAVLAGQRDRAACHLDAVALLAERMDSDLLRWNCGLWRTAAAMDAGEPADALLAAAFEAGARHGFVHSLPWPHAPTLARLATAALDAGITPHHATRLVRVQRLQPVSTESEHWPWPVRVHTLGRFSIVLDGVPYPFQGKMQRKPLDLLKALISLGGREVSLTTLIEALWPDAEGDAGRKAFDVALLRLRRLLGRDDALLLGDGKLSLNDKVCWVDAWALERLVGRATDRDDGPARARQARQALARYRGTFLGQEDTQSWMIAPRERIASKFLRCVLRGGRALEADQRWAEGVELYQRALDAHPVSEELYRRLMHCHWQLGNRAEARAIFDRCRRLLWALLGRMPSRETETFCFELTSS